MQREKVAWIPGKGRVLDRESSAMLTLLSEELTPLRLPPAEACAEADIREFFDDAGGSFFFLGSVADLTSGAALTLVWVGVRERGTPRREVLGVAKWEAALPLRAGAKERWVASGVVQALLGSLVGLRSEGMRQRVGGLVKSKNILPVF